MVGRSALLCIAAAAAAASAYNLVLQEIHLTGGKVTAATPAITCDTITYFHIGKETFNTDCLAVKTTDDPPKTSEIKLVYTSGPITTSAGRLDCEIGLKDSSTVAFSIQPAMKAGQIQELKPDSKYVPVATSDAPPPTEATTVAAPVETTTPMPCGCGTEYCIEKDNCVCADPTCPPNPADSGKKAVVVPAAAAAVEPSVPLAIRLRGPGPARMPASSSSEENNRVKRDAPAVDDDTVHVSVTLYVLDEAGNPAAVWAAVIEGLILLALVGMCCWFFFISPRRRSSGPVPDPYKPENNYSVSYDNTSYNNQRIDAFQNPPAPARPTNNAYMDSYLTDSVAAMSRPAPTVTTQPASAINPSAFQPTHQRFDSSGLVTVNLS